jgi:hypothetical protein
MYVPKPFDSDGIIPDLMELPIVWQKSVVKNVYADCLPTITSKGIVTINSAKDINQGIHSLCNQ